MPTKTTKRESQNRIIYYLLLINFWKQIQQILYDLVVKSWVPINWPD